MVAEVFHAPGAVDAGAIHASDPGYADAGAQGQTGRGSIAHIADDLMARDQRAAQGRKLARNNVEIGAADAAGTDFEQNIARLDCRSRDVF
jgi:hypothetical protein